MQTFSLLYMLPLAIGISLLLLIWVLGTEMSDLLTEATDAPERDSPSPTRPVVSRLIKVWLGAMIVTCGIVYLNRDINAPIYPGLLAVNLAASIGSLMFPIHLAIWKRFGRRITIAATFAAAVFAVAFFVSCLVALELFAG